MELVDADTVAEISRQDRGGAGLDPERGSWFERSGRLARLVVRSSPADQAAGSAKSSTLTLSSSYASSSTGT